MASFATSYPRDSLITLARSPLDATAPADSDDESVESLVEDVKSPKQQQPASVSSGQKRTRRSSPLKPPSPPIPAYSSVSASSSTAATTTAAATNLPNHAPLLAFRDAWLPMKSQGWTHQVANDLTADYFYRPPNNVTPKNERVRGVDYGDESEVILMLYEQDEGLYVHLLGYVLEQEDGVNLLIDDLFDALETRGWDCELDKVEKRHFYFDKKTPKNQRVKHVNYLRHFEVATYLKRSMPDFYYQHVELKKKKLGLLKKEKKKKNPAPEKKSSQPPEKKKPPPAAKPPAQPRARSPAPATKEPPAKAASKAAASKAASKAAPKAAPPKPVVESPPSSSSESESESSSSSSSSEDDDDKDEEDAFVLAAKVATWPFATVWRFIESTGFQWRSDPRSSVVTSGKVYVAPDVIAETAVVDKNVFLDGNSLIFWMDGDDADGRQLRSSFLRSQFKADKLKRQERRRKRKSAAAPKAKAKTSEEKKKLKKKKKESKEAAAAAAVAEQAAEVLLKKMLEEDGFDEAVDKDRSMTAIDDGAEAYFNGTAKRSKLVSTLSNKRGSKRIRKNQNLLPEKAADDEDVQMVDEFDPATTATAADTTQFIDAATCANFSRQNKQTNSSLMSFYKTNLYSRWLFLLSIDYSLLFIGFGSKRDLIDHFGRTVLKPIGDVYTIDGFARGVNIDQILDAVVQCALGTASFDTSAMPAGDCPPVRALSSLGPRLPLNISHSKVLRRAAVIASEVHYRRTRPGTRTKPIYLCIHNLDGLGLRSAEAQQALCVLAVAGQGIFKLIASADNVNSTLGLWDLATKQNFNWAWQDATTFDPYVQEVANFAESSKGKKSKGGNVINGGGKSNAGGVGQVLKSLAPRHAEIMKLLARQQIMNSEAEASGAAGGGASGKSKAVGMEYKEFKKGCQEKLLVTNDTQLGLLLVELQEHALVSRKRNDEGVEYISIPHPPELVAMIRDFGGSAGAK
jgi:origin recognition complex subunit 2